MAHAHHPIGAKEIQKNQYATWLSTKFTNPIWQTTSRQAFGWMWFWRGRENMFLKLVRIGWLDNDSNESKLTQLGLSPNPAKSGWVPFLLSSTIDAVSFRYGRFPIRRAFLQGLWSQRWLGREILNAETERERAA